LLHGHPWAGGTALAFTVGVILGRKYQANRAEDGEESRPSVVEWAQISALIVMALILRVYALNTLTNYFEGELSPFSAAAAASIPGMFEANKGISGP
jgi:hypothetical protein